MSSSLFPSSPPDGRHVLQIHYRAWQALCEVSQVPTKGEETSVEKLSDFPTSQSWELVKPVGPQSSALLTSDSEPRPACPFRRHYEGTGGQGHRPRSQAAWVMSQLLLFLGDLWSGLLSPSVAHFPPPLVTWIGIDLGGAATPDH